MGEENKIRITYEDLSDPKLDEAIKQYTENSHLTYIKHNQKHFSDIKNKKRLLLLYLLLFAIILLLLMWFFFQLFSQLNSSSNNSNLIFSNFLELSIISQIGCI